MRTRGPVLFICTDESNAISVDLISQSSWSTFCIELQPLAKPAITRVLASVCLLPSAVAQACTDTLFSFTQGNPARMMRALRVLYDQGVLHLEACSGQWVMDPELAATTLVSMGNEGFDASAALSRLSTTARSVISKCASAGLTLSLDEVRFCL